MRVFLIHGMGRSRASMALLALRLARQGHAPALFGYGVRRQTLEEIVDRFVDTVRAKVEAPETGNGTRTEPYAVVGHSLGNVITRLASPRLPPGFARFVMLAPPNRPPALARAMRENPFFRRATHDAGRKLTDGAFFEEVPIPDVPSLIIAGTRGPRAAWLPFGGAPNDSIVGVEETRLPGVPSVEVHGVHTFLMNRRDVFALVRGFLDDPTTPPAESAH